ncbi:MAG: phospholipid/cholesterol/gamma-HCH transport system substrate-binding protein [Thermoleophilaceae bacterium]|jgi:virulence factor Mce-like protein|nr:phospholipid/cholesterol/gamma-HCH transport system substrate-binding protein [Thermoleophilaceae bacterium]
MAMAMLAMALPGCGVVPGGHQVSLNVPDATNLILGQEVRMSGQTVGKVTTLGPADQGRAAHIVMTLDDSVWPLAKDTKVALRWGGTVSYDNRYVALIPGDSKEKIADNGVIPASDFVSPVEFDDLLGTFGKKVRADTSALIDNGGQALDAAGPGLRGSLEKAPSALHQAHAVLTDLATESDALGTLVVSSDAAVDAVHAAEPGLRDLIQGGAQTFDALGTQADALQQTLARAPQTLVNARGTLGRADHTLSIAADLTDRLDPGVREVQRLAKPLNDVLRTVDRIGPDARVTLATARRATPDINPLLALAGDQMPRIDSINKQAVHELQCIRPYTPESVAFFSNWGDHFAYGDGKDKYIRATAQAFLPALENNANVMDSAGAAKLFPDLRYGFPRPPGYLAGQPWFLPQCGAGRDAIDPSKDPESRSISQTLKIPPITPLLGMEDDGKDFGK